MEERSIEYERLQRTGELEKLKTGFLHILPNLFSGAIGLSALVIRLVAVIVIV